MRRIRRHRQSEVSIGGEDSFLDIVANLVGVLIILVVIVGAQAGASIHSASLDSVKSQQEILLELTEKIEDVGAQATSYRQENIELEKKVRFESELAKIRERERAQLMVALAETDRTIAASVEQLDAQQKKRVQAGDEIRQLERELERRQRELAAAESLPTTQKQTIDHYPTPIAKTVFSQEIHFRLLDGRLVYVPIEELVELMRREWKVKAEKLVNARKTFETVGPIADFRLQYELASTEIRASTSLGTVTRKGVDFKRFVLVPVSRHLGTPLSVALSEDSEFLDRVGGLDPRKTTISIWVYPDSFAEYNQLKAWLLERGFQTACWPISQGTMISGGPDGFRSSAQ